MNLKKSLSVITAGIIAVSPLVSSVGLEKTIFETQKAKAKTVETAYSVGETFTFGTWNGDPLEWRVLETNGYQMTVITKDCLSGNYFDNEDEDYFDHRYNKTDEDVTWETCDLRQWLNGEFYDKTFTSSEKQNIVKSRIDTPYNPYSNTEGGNSTKDYVWLLSIDEAKNWFKNDADRIAVSMKTGFINDGKGDAWWLRSSSSNRQYGAAIVSAIVDYDGSIHSSGFTVGNYGLGVHPALNLILTKTIQSNAFGDLTGDGKVTSEDATFVLIEYAKALVNNRSSADSIKEFADINKDGKVTSEDATCILIWYANYMLNHQIPTIDKFKF